MAMALTDVARRATDSNAQPADPFSKSKQIRLIGSNAGGNYDQYSRFLVVQNVPTAAGIQAANVLSNVAVKGGLTIAHLQRTIPQAALAGLPGTECDASKFNWFGRQPEQRGHGLCRLA
jgi:hypothetical protein